MPLEKNCEKLLDFKVSRIKIHLKKCTIVKVFFFYISFLALQLEVIKPSCFDQVIIMTTQVFG